MYADVILLKFFHPFDVLAICSALNTDLKSIAEWSTNNALHLNPSKSSLLIVGSSLLLSRIQSFDISLNSIPILHSSSIKILDVYVDSSWSFELHESSSRTAYARLRLLYPLHQVFFCSQKLLTSQLLIISLFDYTNVYVPAFN